MNDVKKITKIEYFRSCYLKLITNQTINEDEKEFLLGCALLLLRKYDGNDDKRIFFDFAYDIVLNYSVKTNDYEPLNDVAFNYGFYPIARFINSKRLLKKISVNEIIYDLSLENYKNDSYIETAEQNRTRKKILNSNGNICFVAPTSSGKSSLVAEHIKRRDNNKKSLIIVPSKSLLSQTFIDIRKRVSDRKIICHDEMYDNDDKFVGILTQERTLRLLENNKGLKIDYLYIDEAHNLFSNDGRNVLLARVIKMCKYNNPNIRIIYLSPFIENVDNLLLNDTDEFEVIEEQRISYNIKDPIIYELRKDGRIYLYNRYLEEFIERGEGNGLFNYIKNNSNLNNFIFIGSPRKIEQFAKDLFENTEPVELTKDIVDLINIIKKTVHKDFLLVRLLEHGILYLHAKIPDVLKDYLEYKFKTINGINYLIANTVILEGINLPIDNLFILDVRSQNNNKILNLIGRVNRLNDVFNYEKGDLSKLLPTIHFINSSYYHGQMKNKIAKLYDKVDDDDVINPLLLNCNLEHIKGKEKKRKIK